MIDNLLRKIIRNIQKKTDTYEPKKYNDKFRCVVCGGKYTRKNKFIHVKTKKHKKKYADLHNKILSLLIVK